MSGFDLHPTLDNLWAINDAAAFHDLKHEAEKELSGGGLSVVYMSPENTPDGMSYLAVHDLMRQNQMVLAFAPLSGKENPMFVDVTDMDEEGIEFEGRIPILARVAINWSEEGASVEVDGSIKTGAILHCTADMNILTYLEDSAALNPIMGEFDGVPYREADKIISGTTCYPQLTELAKSLI